jgi:uncharacterized damage-inducible protein DinB
MTSTETSREAQQSAAQSATQTSRLLAGCHYCLGQCQDLLERVSVEDYRAQSGSQSSVGAHLRHVLERFQSLLNGLPESRIDYDNRRRDPALEQNPDSAAFALNSIRRRLQQLQPGQDPAGTAACLLVSESVHPGQQPVTVSSSIERELMSLVSHSVHHLALIATLLRPLGYRLGEQFGKAPSTLIHQSRS